MTSIEKLKAKANATVSHIDSFTAATIVITRQNKLAIIVRAFFSVKYFFIKGFFQDSDGKISINGNFKHDTLPFFIKMIAKF
jgi:hypothetical protein